MKFQYGYDWQKEIVGNVIESFEMAPDGDWIIFRFKDDPPLKLSAKGDCCSYSWIEGIDLPNALQGRVLAAESILMPDLGNVGTAKCNNVDKVNYYGLKITTENGIAVIDYRNSSNGYYGGWLDPVEVE